MTPQQFKEEMERTYPARGYDPECAHSHADYIMMQILRQLGYGEGLDIYDKAEKWYA